MALLAEEVLLKIECAELVLLSSEVVLKGWVVTGRGRSSEKLAGHIVATGIGVHRLAQGMRYWDRERIGHSGHRVP